jgi:hypothetical protein
MRLTARGTGIQKRRPGVNGVSHQRMVYFMENPMEMDDK